MFQVTIERADIANGKSCYQSSTVDNQVASMALKQTDFNRFVKKSKE
jgi:hypothetical protein